MKFRLTRELSVPGGRKILAQLLSAHASQKESVRFAWATFKSDPFHPSLGTHEIRALSARAGHTIYSAVIESDLRVLFRIDGSWGDDIRRRHA